MPPTVCALPPAQWTAAPTPKSFEQLSQPGKRIVQLHRSNKTVYGAPDTRYLPDNPAHPWLASVQRDSVMDQPGFPLAQTWELIELTLKFFSPHALEAAGQPVGNSVSKPAKSDGVVAYLLCFAR